MARKRILHPDMFSSENIASMPVASRWTWVGMLTYLDDYGRGKDNPALVKATVWPLDESYTSKKVAADLDRLVAMGTLCRYECCGLSLLHSPNWANFQKIAHPLASKLCPCPVHEANAEHEAAA
ncbi:MAG: hypothetical protein ACXV5Q_00815 [Frankiaceae bacterium]